MARLCLRTILVIVFAINDFKSDFCFAQTDQTLEPKASGKDVVDAAYYKVKSVFGDDHRFLIRLAWVESQFGKHPKTYRKGYFGGIWQVDKSEFQDTQNVDDSENLKFRNELIKAEFGIDWSSVKWEDLAKPLYSALAARLILLNKPQKPPTSVEDQAEYWKTYYDSAKGNDTKQKFVNDVKILESCKSSKSKCRMDLIVVLDGSGSIGLSNFQRAKEFVVGLVNCIINRYTRIGFLVYSSKIDVIFPLTNNISEFELQGKIVNAHYPEGSTTTADAIDAAIKLIYPSPLSVNGIPSESGQIAYPKLMIVLTDGQSDSPPATSKSAMRAAKSGIISYAIGIGNGINIVELTNIAGSKEDQVLTISSYSHLTDLLYQTRTQTCSKPQRPKRQTVIQDFVYQYEISYYAFKIPQDGLTFFLNVTEGDAFGYYSYGIENPTAALNDGILVKGKNYIPPPPVVTVKPIFQTVKQRSRARRAMHNEDVQNKTMTNAKNEFQFDSVFIAIEGKDTMNNYTIFTEAGGTPSMTETGALFLVETRIFISGLILAISSSHYL